MDDATRSEIIEMALSDHTSFDAIESLHGLSADQVKTLMRNTAIAHGASGCGISARGAQIINKVLSFAGHLPL